MSSAEKCSLAETRRPKVNAENRLIEEGCKPVPGWWQALSSQLAAPKGGSNRMCHPAVAARPEKLKKNSPDQRGLGTLVPS